MTDASPVHSLNCPNCGAPVEFPEGQASVRCRFCDSSIERSVAALTDDDDANTIRIDASGMQSPGGPTGPARRFVIKMRNGQPVVIEMGKGPAAAPTTEQMFNAARAANAAAGPAPTAAGLRLVRFKSAADNKSHAILNETLDWQTGQSSGQTETRLNLPTIIFDAPSWTVWENDTLWMVIENELLGFDAAGNTIVYRWP